MFMAKKTVLRGKDLEELNAQWYDKDYWQTRFSIVSLWDQMIEDFNKKTGITA